MIECLAIGSSAIQLPDCPNRIVVSEAVDLAAGVRLELVPDSLRSNLGFYDDVYMVGSCVRNQQVPAAVRAMPLQGLENHYTACWVEHKGLLEQWSTFYQDALWIGLQQPAANPMVMSIHRAQFVAV